MADEEGGAWYFITDSNIIKNLDRMPIHHKINQADRKRIIRTSSRHSTAKTRASISKDSEDSFYITTSVAPQNSDYYDLDSPVGSDSEKEDKHDDGKRSESEKVYMAACKQCHVAPGKGVLLGLTSQRMSIKGLQLTSRDIEPITYALTRNTQVTTLDVSSNDIGKDGLNNILRMLDENMCITSLNISHNNVGSAGARMLSEVIANNKLLKTISASGNRFTDDDADCLSEALKVARCLQSLNLSHNNFHERGGELLAEAIGYIMTGATCGTGDAHSSGTHDLIFGFCGEENTSLTDLDLSWNHLRLGGATAIAMALKENNTLETMNIAWNGFSNEGCKVVSASLEVNTKLRILNLSNNRIGYEGARALARALLVNQSLTHLQLNLNSLSTLGAFDLLMAIRDNPKSAIEKLELEEVPVVASAQVIEQEIKSARPSFILIHDVVVLSDDHIALASVVNKKKGVRS